MQRRSWEFRCFISILLFTVPFMIYCLLSMIFYSLLETNASVVFLSALKVGTTPAVMKNWTESWNYLGRKMALRVWLTVCSCLTAVANSLWKKIFARSSMSTSVLYLQLLWRSQRWHSSVTGSRTPKNNSIRVPAHLFVSGTNPRDLEKAI